MRYGLEIFLKFILMKKQLSTLSFLLIIVFTLSSCGAIVKSKAKKYATVEKGAIPADFGENNTVVLFVTSGKRSYDTYLKSNIKKAYHGKYELVSKSELRADRYSNTAKYRYIFDYKSVSYAYHSDNAVIYGQSANTGMNNATGQVRRFLITDRTDDKEYVMSMTSGFWSKIQRMYLRNMETVRIKNTTGKIAK